MPQWIQYSFTKDGPASTGSRLGMGVRLAVAGYSITARRGPEFYEEGVVHNLYGVYDSPSKWEFQGSFDGEVWFTLHAVSDVIDWHESEEKRFECPPYLTSTNDPVEVGYYRLLILDVVGRPTGEKFVAISELGLYAQSPGLLTVDVGLSTDILSEASRELYFAYYRPFKFRRMYPMSGNINGGTEIHLYGEGFINYPDLRCLFELLYVQAVYYSPTHIVCPSPQQRVIAPKVTLTLNGKDFVACQNCTWVPGRCADTQFCSWDCNPSSYVKKDAATGYDWCEGQGGGCYYGSTDSKGRCVDLVQLDSFTYYRFPIVLAISPTAGPRSGGTAITATGTFLQPFIGGHDIYCRIGTIVFRGNYLPSIDDQGSIVCITPPGLKLGVGALQLSFNGAQWDNRGNTFFLTYAEPIVSAIIPSSTPLDVNLLPGFLALVHKDLVHTCINLINSDFLAGQVVTIVGSNLKSRLDDAVWAVWFGSFQGAVMDSSQDTQMIVTPPRAFPFPAQTNLRLELQGFSYRYSIPFAFRSYSPTTECYLDCSNAQGYGNCFDGKQLDSQNRLVSVKSCNCTNPGRAGLGCTAQIAISSFTPHSSPSTGGTVVSLSLAGTERYDIQKYIVQKYHDNPDYFLCRFGSIPTQATIKAPSAWNCQTPPLQYNGSLRIQFSLDRGATWFDDSFELFFYFTPPTLFNATPSTGPVLGGTIVTIRSAFNHTFVAPPRQKISCYMDEFGRTADIRTTFDRTSDVFFFRSQSSLCAYEVSKLQHDVVSCSFSNVHETFQVPGTIMALDLVHCVSPPWKAKGMVSLSVTMDGQTWSSQELEEGVMSQLQFQYYSQPVIMTISPDLGPYTETTEITLHGFNLSPGGNLSATCLFQASAGQTSPVVLRQARRTWKAMAVFVHSENAVVCVSPKFSTVLNDVQWTQQLSPYLRRSWTCEVRAFALSFHRFNVVLLSGVLFDAGSAQF